MATTKTVAWFLLLGLGVSCYAWSNTDAEYLFNAADMDSSQELSVAELAEMSNVFGVPITPELVAAALSLGEQEKISLSQFSSWLATVGLEGSGDALLKSVVASDCTLCSVSKQLLVVDERLHIQRLFQGALSAGQDIQRKSAPLDSSFLLLGTLVAGYVLSAFVMCSKQNPLDALSLPVLALLVIALGVGTGVSVVVVGSGSLYFGLAGAATFVVSSASNRPIVGQAVAAASILCAVFRSAAEAHRESLINSTLALAVAALALSTTSMWGDLPRSNVFLLSGWAIMITAVYTFAPWTAVAPIAGSSVLAVAAAASAAVLVLFSTNLGSTSDSDSEEESTLPLYNLMDSPVLLLLVAFLLGAASLTVWAPSRTHCVFPSLIMCCAAVKAFSIIRFRQWMWGDQAASPSLANGDGENELATVPVDAHFATMWGLVASVIAIVLAAGSDSILPPFGSHQPFAGASCLFVRAPASTAILSVFLGMLAATLVVSKILAGLQMWSPDNKGAIRHVMLDLLLLALYLTAPLVLLIYTYGMLSAVSTVGRTTLNILADLVRPIFSSLSLPWTLAAVSLAMVMLQVAASRSLSRTGSLPTSASPSLSLQAAPIDPFAGSPSPAIVFQRSPTSPRFWEQLAGNVPAFCWGVGAAAGREQYAPAADDGTQ